jgi:hypothetical protein
MSAIPRFALRYEWRNNSVLFLHNLHEQPREILVDPGVDRAEGKLLVNLLAEDHSRANESGKHRIVPQGNGYCGTGSADSTICCVGPTSISVIPTPVDKSFALPSE